MNGLLRVSLGITALLALMPLRSWLQAKPPDLPRNDLPMAAPAAPPPTSGEGPTCPYLRQQAADRHAAQLADPDVSHDVLSNLDRLEAAQALLDAAAKLDRAGQHREALDCLQRVQKLCPGSRCAAEAAGRARALAARTAPQVRTYAVADLLGEELSQVLDLAPCECKGRSPEGMLIEHLHHHVCRSTRNAAYNEDSIEYFPETMSLVITETPQAHEAIAQLLKQLRRKQKQLTQKKAASSQSCEPGVEEQVRGLIKACRLAVSDGRLELAARLAREAHALAPERVLSDPLLAQMYAQADKPARCSTPAADEPTCPVCNACRQQVADAGRRSGEQEESAATGTMGQSLKQLEQWLDRLGPGTLMVGLGLDETLNVILQCNVTVGDTVYHLVLGKGSPRLWTTTNASVSAKKKAG
jgi:hypothetical protein